MVATTTHKTLRGPRGGMILCDKSYAEAIDKAVFPHTQGGPLEHVIAAKAVAFAEALRPEFKDYAAQIVRNARALRRGACSRAASRVVSGGTDNHLFVIDLSERRRSRARRPRTRSTARASRPRRARCRARSARPG